VQPADVRSATGGRYYVGGSSLRSDLHSINGGLAGAGSGGSCVVPASRVAYRPSATLINPRYHKNKQYVPRSSGVVTSRTAASTTAYGGAGTTYRAVPRSRAASDWH